MKNIILKNKSGSALAYILVMTAVVSIILVSILQFVASQIKWSSHEVRKEQAFQMAEAGVNDYIWYITKQIGSTTDPTIIEDFWSGSPRGVGTTYVAGFPANDPIGQYKIEIIPPGVTTSAFTVKSTGWMNSDPSIKKTIQTKLKKEEWSEYVMASDAIFSAGAGAVYRGKVHANGGMKFDGLAYDEVSSSVACFKDGGINYYGVNNNADSHPSYPCPNPPPNNFFPSRPSVFRAGRFIKNPVAFSGMVSSLEYMKNKASDGTHGIYFPNYVGAGTTTLVAGRKITLKSDGTFDSCAVLQYQASGIVDEGVGKKKYISEDGSTKCRYCTTGACLRNRTIIDKGLIFVEGNVGISGVLANKKISVIAADMSLSDPDVGGKDVYLANDITYSHSDGTEMLGIIGQNNVLVTQNCESDLYIQASIVAKNGRTGIHDTFTTSKSVLTLFGARITKGRSFYEGTHGGFSTRNYNYDPNLANESPPFFPTKAGYIVDSWEEL